MQRRLTEAEARKSRIDPLLEKAGWSLERSNLSTEFLLSDLATPRKVDHDLISREGNEFIDYVLHGRDNNPLAMEGGRVPAGLAGAFRPGQDVLPHRRASPVVEAPGLLRVLPLGFRGGVQGTPPEFAERRRSRRRGSMVSSASSGWIRWKTMLRQCVLYAANGKTELLAQRASGYASSDSRKNPERVKSTSWRAAP
jgi:hypothetical protein